MTEEIIDSGTVLESPARPSRILYIYIYISLEKQRMGDNQ